MDNRKFAAVAAMSVMLGLGALTPASAISAPTASSAECSGSWVKIDARGDQVSLRSRPDATSQILESFHNGEFIEPCRKLVLGTRYNACGQVNANGWIMVQSRHREGWSGYIPSVCATDHS